MFGAAPVRSVALALALVACSSVRTASPADAPPTVARAYRIAHSGQLLAGATATGRLGDVRMDNGVIAVVINAPDNVLGFALSGGNLVDAARLDRGAIGADALQQIFLYLDDTFPRQGAFDALTIEVASGNEAVVVALGVDSGDPRVAIRQEYRLATGADYLTLRTTLTNRGDAALTDFELGDVIQWGRCERFVPGLGEGRGELVAPWLAGVGDDVSYAYAAAAGELSGPHGTSWSDPIVATVTIEPGESASFERYLVVGDRSGPASVAGRVRALRGEATVSVAGTARGPLGEPVVGAAVELWRDGDQAPRMRALTDAQGGFAIPTEPGDYTLRASAPGRPSADFREVRAAASAAPLEVALPHPSSLRVTVTEAGAPVAARLTVLGIEGTETPDFGPRYRAAGADNVVVTSTGEAILPLLPGRYRLFASRGLEYDLAQADVVLPPGVQHAVPLSIARVVATRGYIGGDFHQHALPSGDSALTLADRVIANLAEGVEILVSSDHNQVTDYGPVVRKLGVAGRLATIVGVEATSETQGHYNAFPVPYRPDRPRAGAPAVGGRTAGEILTALRRAAPEGVVQINHPRTSGIGYFAITEFEPGAVAPGQRPPIDLDVDALEVVNGRRMNDTAETLADWFWMLDRGLVTTAMGSADSHAISEAPVGYPRAYLGVGFDDPARLTDAIVVDTIARRRDVVTTSGPFVSLRTSDGSSAIGRTLAGPAGASVEVVLEVQAAPWIDVSSVELYANGGLLRPPTPITTARSALVRYRETLLLPVRDGAWYVVVVRGDEPLDPVIPGMIPLAIANPIWTKAAPSSTPSAAIDDPHPAATGARRAHGSTR